MQLRGSNRNQKKTANIFNRLMNNAKRGEKSNTLEIKSWQPQVLAIEGP